MNQYWLSPERTAPIQVLFYTTEKPVLHTKEVIMITVKVEMDIIATATMSYPDDSLENLVELVDNDREKFIKRLRPKRNTATSMVILEAVDDHGQRIMSRTLVEPNYADAGCFLESAIMNTTPKDMYIALHSLCMDEEYIVGTLPRCPEVPALKRYPVVSP
jgi:hypothetical protein